MKKVGLLFGSFNPIHISHLLIGELAIELGYVDEVIYVVSPASPYKIDSGTLISEEHRANMVRLATRYHTKFSVSTIEFVMEKPSYTYKTLQSLKENNINTEFHFICGTDVYVDIPNWVGGNDVIESVSFLVYPRATSTNYVPESMSHKTQFLNGVPTLEISSTFIRDQIKKGGTTNFLIPGQVKTYISIHNLYK